MADDIKTPDIATDEAIPADAPAIGGTQGAAGAIPDEVTSGEFAGLTEEEYIRRRAMGDAVDDNAAAHMGGMGSQGGQTDFGAAGNLQGYDKSNF